MSDPQKYLDAVNDGTFGSYIEHDMNRLEISSSPVLTAEPKASPLQPSTEDFDRSASASMVPKAEPISETTARSVNPPQNEGTISLFTSCFGYGTMGQNPTNPLSAVSLVGKLFTNEVSLLDASTRATSSASVSDDTQLKIGTPIVTDNEWLVVDIDSPEPLELIEAKTQDAIIPLETSSIKTEQKEEYSRHQLAVSIHMNHDSDAHVLRVQSVKEPLRTWFAQLKNDHGVRMSGIRQEERTTEKQKRNLSKKKTYVHDPHTINMLLIGRSQVGKSTLIEALENPDYTSTRTGLSQTLVPSFRTVTLTSDEGEKYTVNIIDTPGLHEVRRDESETRTNEQLLALLKQLFDSGQVQALNVIGFVSVIGKTYQNDIDTFKSLIDFCGDRFKRISTLILTHCDKLSTDRMDRLTEDLKNHSTCTYVMDYCQLGIHHYGILDVDDLNTYKEQKTREAVRQTILEHLIPMRTEFKKFLLSSTTTYVEIEATDFDYFAKWDDRIADPKHQPFFRRYRCSVL